MGDCHFRGCICALCVVLFLSGQIFFCDGCLSSSVFFYVATPDDSTGNYHFLSFSDFLSGTSAPFHRTRHCCFDFSFFPLDYITQHYCYCFADWLRSFSGSKKTDTFICYFIFFSESSYRIKHISA